MEKMLENSFNKHLPDKFGIKKGAEEFPLMVVVSVSYVCNAKCPNCPYTQSDIRNSYKDAKFIDPLIFNKIAEECGKFGSLLRITGGGEPLLHPYMVKMIIYAKKVGAKVGLITNGSLLTFEVTNKLLEVGIDAIEISVDAADKETYSIVRAGLDFDKLVNNVRYLVGKRNYLKTKTKVIVSIIDQQVLSGRLEESVSFWEKIVDDVQVRKYLTWGIVDPDKAGDKNPYIPEMPKRIPCPFPFERLNVDSRGKVEFCGYDIAGITDFGNVKDITIESIWKGDKFNQWRKMLLDGRYEEIGICKECPDWKYRSWKYNYWEVMDKAEHQRDNRISVNS
jgi:MoaA/NifB/PqqE/SkfB family radical SAM enzyme